MLTRLVWLVCAAALALPPPRASTSHSRVITFGSSRSMDTKPPERHIPALAPRVPSEFRASLLQIPLFGDEHLLTQIVNLHPTAAISVGIIGRLWSDEKREIQRLEEIVPVAANGSQAVRTTVFERGALLTLSVRVLSANVEMGQAWARLVLTKGLPPGAMFPATVAQGYLGNFADLAWPGSPIQDTHSGKGWIRTITLNDLGATMDITVPAGRRWRIITGTVDYNLVASVNPQYVAIDVFDATGVLVYSSLSQPQQPAGTNGLYALVPGGVLVPPAGQGFYVLPWPPDLELSPGYRLALGSRNPFVTDNMFDGFLLVREWYAP